MKSSFRSYSAPLDIHYFLLGKILMVLILLLVSDSIFAQTNCSQSLKLAEKKFESGQLKEVPDIISECLRTKRFSNEEMVNAYKMLTLTYLYLDDSLNAEITFFNLLRDYPDFEIRESIDPAELSSLFKTYRTLPLYSFGLYAGINLTYQSVIKTYGVDNHLGRTERNQTLPGYSAGLKIEMPLSKKHYLSSGFQYNVVRSSSVRSLATTTQTNENGVPFNFAEVFFLENQSWVNIPFSMGTIIGNKNLKQYFFAGGSAGYLINAKAKASRKFVYTGGAGNELTGPDINISALRNNFSYHASIGAGIRIKSGVHFITLEAQYDLGLRNVVNPERRYSNSQLYNRYGYVDNDFKMNTIHIKASYMITRYKPIKIK